MNPRSIHDGYLYPNLTMKRRRTTTREAYRDPYGDRDPAPSSRPAPKSPFEYAKLAILAGVFILGIGVGIGFSSSAGLDPQSVASRDFIDRSVPNPELCAQYGASAISMDTRFFVTLSPFNVYVSQPSMQPGCVVRNSNIALMEREGVVDREQLNDCKRRMNTFAFTGDVKNSPKVNCVYQNDAAENLFLDVPEVRKVRRDSENF